MRQWFFNPITHAGVGESTNTFFKGLQMEKPWSKKLKFSYSTENVFVLWTDPFNHVASKNVIVCLIEASEHAQHWTVWAKSPPADFKTLNIFAKII